MGEEVLRVDPAQSPTRVLAMLEQAGATRVIIEAAMLARLCAEPAAELTNLAQVRRVDVVGGRVDPRADLLFPGAEIRRGALTAEAEPADVVASASAAADRVGAVPPRTAAEGVVVTLETAVLSSMLRALQRSGVLDDPARTYATATVVAAVRVAPQHVPLVGRWLRALADAGWIPREANGYRGAPPVGSSAESAAWDAAQRQWIDGGFGGPAFVSYLRRNAECLDGLLAGDIAAVMLLFPEGRTELADAVYRDTAIARLLNEAIAGAVCRLGISGATRVLEVGAGTCATSEVVLARAATAGIQLHYTATDVSRFFLTTGRSRLPGARFAELDFNRSPIVQGFPPHSADVVVAAGALNAARDVGAAVRGLAQLLAPGGWLLVSEPTREHVEILASQAFMMSPPVDARMRTGTSFLDRTRWAEVFAGAGLVLHAALPGEDHALAPLGQRLFLVQVPDSARCR
ncbi:class I SAM-dependent methyltransferase [Rhizomonospora bruguierae]|uniref:class I SAM-dependent methyltransferase n=1 Tax=Rhizomonospora bruguierae TaxID=1581705 RepID=UPI001BCF958E|nr:class I SAM-dependent methyltransferase [Micromonospora sp. NBRC 107566]